MNAANIVIDKIKSREVSKAKPVIRHGEEVRIRPAASKKEIISGILRDIDEFRSLSYKSVAIICKTLRECREVHSALSRHIDGVILITGKEDEYRTGIAVLPACRQKALSLTP